MEANHGGVAAFFWCVIFPQYGLEPDLGHDKGTVEERYLCLLTLYHSPTIYIVGDASLLNHFRIQSLDRS